MTKNMPDKPITIAMVLNETSKQSLDSNSHSYIKEFCSGFPFNKYHTMQFGCIYNHDFSIKSQGSYL
jgi:hypothetical protein